jgi:hypothetical protein
MPEKRQFSFQVFDSFTEAEEADIAETKALTPEERLQITESLRAQYYGYKQEDPRTQPRFDRTFTFVSAAQS